MGRTLCHFLLLIALLCLTAVCPVLAQTLSITHSFDDGTVPGAGRYPQSGLVLGSDGNFYGTTSAGGTTGYGTVFKITPAGTETILHSFNDGTVQDDGYSPTSALVPGSDGNFYGTTYQGGTAGQGTVFKITPSGTETILHSFNDGTVQSDGYEPLTALLLGSDGNFYGTTYQGGAAGQGTVFKITPSGTETILHSFGDGSVADDGSYASALIQASDGDFYGTATYGGAAGSGMVFKITSGGAETIVYSFEGSSLNDGDEPSGPLVIGADGNFYGVTSYGGTANYGTVFKVTPTGTETVLHGFAGFSDGSYPQSALTIGNDGDFYGVTSYTVYKITSAGTETILHIFGNGTVQNDGAVPEGALVLSGDGNFYGTTSQGGVADVGLGTVYKITQSGTETILYRFGEGTAPDNGNHPNPLLLGSDGNFYGTTREGGTANDGLVFKITPNGEETVLYNFQGTFTDPQGAPNDGYYPQAALIQGKDGNFYGTTSRGGSGEAGIVFRITPAGAETVLYNFPGYSDSGSGLNSALVVGGDGNFYGTASGGGSAGYGTVYEITPTGSVTILHDFGDGTVQNDGNYPDAALVLGADGDFYGTTSAGGSAQEGTVFKITPAGTVTILHDFMDGTVQNDGSNPQAALIIGNDGDFYGTTPGAGTVFKITPTGTETILSKYDGFVADDIASDAALVLGHDGNFYGTNTAGGSAGDGSVFKITPGGIVTVFHSFLDGTVQNDGDDPGALVLSSDGTLYGTTLYGGSANAGTVFTLSVPSPPSATLTSLSPDSAAVGSAAFTVAITGTGFVNGAVAEWNGTTLTTTFVSVTQVTASVPAALVQMDGTERVTVVNTGAAFSNSLPFTIFTPPTITSFTPTSGPVGTVVTITGTDLNSSHFVNFNEAIAPVLSSNAQGTQLTVAVPFGAVSGAISIFTPTGFAESAMPFIVTGVPTITSFSPASGPVGISVTIAGTNFAGATAVAFHGTSATFAVISATQITTTVPTGATTGAISITTPDGIAMSAAPFTITSPPTITRISPASGAAGTVVTITGTDLTGVTSVTVGGVAVAFTVVNSTTVTFTLPAGLAGGTVVVTTAGGTATGTVSLVVLTWTAGAVGAGPNGMGTVLWNRSDGAAGLWVLNGENVQFTVGPTYGPYSGWTAKALATAADGTSRVLWTNANGEAGVWSYNATGIETVVGPTYGPYSGWTAKSIGVAGDGTSRVLWINTSGAAGVWTFGTNDAETVIGPTYGPYSGWTANALATAGDGTSRVLWNNVSGAAGVWSFSTNDVEATIGTTYGPYSGWTAKSVGTAGNGTSRVLWTNASGAAGVWSFSAGDVETAIGTVYGPYGGWTAGALATAGDGTSRVLWSSMSRAAGVWTFGVNDVNTLIGPTYGPF